MFHASPKMMAHLDATSKTASTLPPDQRAFLDAAKKGDAHTLRELLAKGVPVDVREDFDMPWEQTALMHAAFGGHLEAVQVLLKAGASVSAVDKNAGDSEGGNTALHHAMHGKNPAVVEALLAAGAEVNAWSTSRNTPINHAIRENFPEAVRLLVKRGANLGSKFGKKQGRSPLVAAAEATWERVPAEVIRDFITLLLEAGADPNGTGNRSTTALSKLATARDIPNEIAIPLMEALLKAGAKPDLMDADGSTALISAVAYENPPAVRLLVKAGADVNRIFLPRHATKERTVLDMNDSDVKQKDNDEASAKRYREVSKILLAAGAKRRSELP